jgi:hypothetical protein
MKSRFFLKLASVAAAFVFVGWLDFATGYEVTSFPLYLLPIGLAFFHFGKAGGYLAVLVATGCWFTNDFLTGHNYASEAIRYWNAGARLLIYGLFVYGLSLYTKTLATHRERVEQLRRVMPMCHGCGKLLWKDGTWKTPQEALDAAKAGDLPECPACAELGKTGH